MVSYRSAFGIRGSPLGQELLGKLDLPSGYAGGPTIFLLPRIESQKGSRFRKSQKRSCVLQADSSKLQLRARSSA
jgi:hypothetical protein